MKIEKITYQHPYVIGPFLQDKLGMEISIDTDAGETPEDAYTLARSIMDNWHKTNNPHLEGMTITDLPVVQPERMDEPFDSQTDEGIKMAEEFAQVKAAVESFTYQEDAIEFLYTPDTVAYGWKLNFDLKQIINSKPKRP